ncbi:hypothetical protein EL22_22315 [Halostagnicola sp. A56]|uniref:hypothetical protein n=1 Tax=Halostagnicola sp. A56 TaxID=1495067 RepID=UPI00049F6D61|nr:hypothetical protein [Halostagnicola sp. A56]KDE60466.1 hypothetical protein EL22_22315 [Halostagnicola sp. A56]
MRETTIAIILIVAASVGTIAVAGVTNSSGDDLTDRDTKPDDGKSNVLTNECHDALNASNESIDANVSVDELPDDAEIECEEMDDESMLNITIETNDSSDDGTTVTSTVRTIVWDTEDERVVSHSVATSTSSQSTESNGSTTQRTSTNQSSTIVTGEESVDIDRGDVVAEDGEDGEDGEINVSTG